jgi:hypothetical protein
MNAVRTCREQKSLPERTAQAGSRQLPAHTAVPYHSAVPRRLQRKPACACGGSCPRCMNPAVLQSKLAISEPRDIYEQEADQIAEQVMRMPASEVERRSPALVTSGIQRQVGEPEIEDELVKALEATGATVQRQQDEREEAEKDDEEEKLMQAKAAGGPTRPVATDMETQIHSLEGGGEPLSLAVRNFMEPRFGHDFSHVRVHADAKANQVARAVTAHAFTVGRNVAFAAGQYAPQTPIGQRLLAHELTHVMQQDYRPSRIQRKIIIGGKPYTPTAKYYAYLDKNFGPHMKEFVKNMHNDGKPPDFTFSSYEQMGYEVRVRHQITKGMDEAHGGSCNYPDSAHPDHLDSAYWDRIGWMHFEPKSPLPAGKEASDAIEAIFAPGADTRLECQSMTVAVEYYSLLKGLGKTKFNALFPGGAGLEISARLSTGAHPTFYGSDRLYKNITLSSKSEILTGDWVYFKNFADYLTKQPGGAWQGENAVYMGGGKYRGFGVSSMAEADMNTELVRVYNLGLPVADQKTVADLLAAGGGLQLSPVFRPDIVKLAP